MSCVVVTKSSPVLVRPASEPMTPTGIDIVDLELSPYDKVLVRSVQTALLLFSRPIPSPAETIKTALSQALVHYQPIAGRLHAGVDGGFAIKCSGEGVSFIAASADCAMEDAEFSVGSVVATVLLDELATYYEEDTAGGCRLIADPLMMVQVTCTVFEAVSAVLWQCRTRAVMSESDPEAPTALMFSANVRKLAGAKEGYYGNCLAAQVVVARSGAVAGADIVDLVQMVRRAKERIPDQFRQGGDGSSLECESSSPVGLFGYENVFIVTCWRNLVLEDADFGSGRPTRVMSHKKHKVGMPTCFITGDGRDGSYVLSGCVKGEHAQAFLTELGRRFTR